MEEIKNRLQVYIEAGDEKLLKLLYIVAREYNNEKELQLSEDETQLLEERWESYKNAESKGYSWDEVIEIIGKNKSQPRNHDH